MVEPMLMAKQSPDPWAGDRGLTERLPAGTEPILRRGLSPNPADRQQTPAELAEAFTVAVQAAENEAVVANLVNSLAGGTLRRGCTVCAG